MLWRLRAFPDFCEPCLPSPVDRPPAGSDWIHEIKHDGFRLLARRGAAGVRLFTRNGHDWTERFPLIDEAVTALRVRTCLIDGEAICCDDEGVAVFHKLCQRRNDQHVVLCAFDLLELNGQDLRREPIERRKVLLVRLLAKARIGLQVNITSWSRATSSSATPASSASRASCLSDSARSIVPAARETGSR